MPRPWGSEPYDVPLGAPPGAQAWAPPAGRPVAAPAHAWFSPPSVRFATVPPRPAGVHVPAWAPVPVAPASALVPVHSWPPVGPHPIFAFEAQPSVVHVPARPKPRLVSGARWAQALSAASTVLLVADALLEVGRRAFVSFLGRPVGAGADDARAVLLSCSVAALAGAWLTASVWLARTVRTARDLDPDAVPYPGFFAWVAWLLPLFHLVLPVVLVRDAWAVGARGRVKAVRPRVARWWTAWLAAGALGSLSAVLGVTTGPGLDVWWLVATTAALLTLVAALHAWTDVLDGVARALDRP